MEKIKEVYGEGKCEEVTHYVSASKKIKDSSITEKYYDLVTDFFEFGWGKSFHFAPQKKEEKAETAMLRYEFKIADVLHLKSGMKVLDVGCGVAGPMKNIAQYSKANIVGLNINEYQIAKGKAYTERHGLGSLCSFHRASFMETGLEDECFDAIYAIEATPHAPDKVLCFKELFRLLKPGGLFAGYEYCLLEAFDEQNTEHVQIMEDLEHGGGLQRTLRKEEIAEAFRLAGFEVLELTDDCTEHLSWILPLEKGFRSSKIGRILTNWMVRVLEFVRIAPKGSTKVSSFLNLGANAFVEAGKRKIFTPNLFFLVKKP